MRTTRWRLAADHAHALLGSEEIGAQKMVPTQHFAQLVTPSPAYLAFAAHSEKAPAL
jgi:hypothetical protein